MAVRTVDVSGVNPDERDDPAQRQSAGHRWIDNEDAVTASLNADLYDPNTNTFSSAGANVYPRLHHSNSLLLPDATVLLTGGNPQRGTYEPRLEIYSPAYLFNSDGTPAFRPNITAVTPGTVGYGATFQVQTLDAAEIGSVVLVQAPATSSTRRRGPTRQRSR
jgi:hypothetical protein